MNPARAKQRSLDEYYPGSVRVKLIFQHGMVVPVRRSMLKKTLERERSKVR